MVGYMRLTDVLFIVARGVQNLKNYQNLADFLALAHFTSSKSGAEHEILPLSDEKLLENIF